MNRKLILTLAAATVVIVGAVFLVVRMRRPGGAGQEIITDQRQLINVLPIEQRPFVALFPHSSNKLITLYVINKNDARNLALEIEYLSGNALKGGRTSVPADASFPYTKAFLLGSCSAGGKCSFDTDITTVNIKTKLDLGTEAHVLRSNYFFISGADKMAATSDRKIVFEPTRLNDQLIIGGSHGYPAELDRQAAMEPVYLTSTGAAKISGTLTLTASEATDFVIWDGEEYQQLEATQGETGWEIELNHTPEAIETQIIRDDLKGAEEDITLYLLGPIVAVK
jgi:hypothetical protein